VGSQQQRRVVARWLARLHMAYVCLDGRYYAAALHRLLGVLLVVSSSSLKKKTSKDVQQQLHVVPTTTALTRMVGFI
jgi:hypothetical protein